MNSRRFIRAGIFAAASLTALSAAAQKPADKASAKAPEPPKPTVIKPAKAYEVCALLSSAQRLEYTFSTNKPVDFNIHYHKGETAYYPVKRAKTKGEADRFTPATGRSDYCMMWENKSTEDVELTYSYKVLNQ
jgi:hypothetical protein